MSWVATVQSHRDQGFTFFDFLTAVDLEQDGFEVVLRLWDPLRHQEALLTHLISREDPRLPTITAVFKGAAWHERATADLFGITFAGHETTPLLLSASFEGHPLRKDFVLAARVAKQWPGAKEPGESEADLAVPNRRRPRPPGVATEGGP